MPRHAAQELRHRFESISVVAVRSRDASRTRRQRLIFGAAMLEEEKTLGEYNIAPGVTLRLVQKLKSQKLEVEVVDLGFQ